MRILLFFILVIICLQASAEISVTDDTGETVSLTRPAKRIISLSPGMTELLFEAGAGQYLQGVVSFSDYPPQAKELPVIGDYNSLDIERILALKPDLIVAWKSGNPPMQLSKLKGIGLPVYIAEPREFSDIGRTLIQFGRLAETMSQAYAASMEFQNALDRLSHRYSKDKTVSKTVFIQIWSQPLMSINGQHLISRIVEFCNGHNIYHDVAQLTMKPDVESVLAKNPDVILVTRQGELGEQWLSRWDQWDFLNAVKNGALYQVNPDYLVRHTPRIIQGIQQVCGLLQPQIK